MKEFIPMLKIWRINKLAPLLFIIQVAVTFTILTNTLFLLSQKYEFLSKPTGLDNENTFSFSTRQYISEEERFAGIDTDLATIRAVDGVIGATFINSIPYTGWGRALQVGLSEKVDEYISMFGQYSVDEGAEDAMALKILAGRSFTASDVVYTKTDAQFITTKAIISKPLALALYPRDWKSAVGKTVFIAGVPQQVVGIAEHVKSAWSWWGSHDKGMLLAAKENHEEVSFLIRVEPGRMQEVQKNVIAALQRINDQREFDYLETFAEVVEKSHQSEQAAFQTLLVVVIAVTLISLLGISGQSRFNIVRQRKQIGIKRALGASKQRIVSYYVMENLIMAISGVLVGLIFAIIYNVQLVNFIELPPIKFEYLILGALLTPLISLLGAFSAIKAAIEVPPAIATRSA